MRRIKAFSAAFLFISDISTFSAKAETSLAELQARLERAQKENLLLKAEKVERENLTIKAEALEQENAKLRAEAGKETRSQSVKPQTVITRGGSARGEKLIPKIASRDTLIVPPRGNRIVDSIPKDDPRREMSAKVGPVLSIEPTSQSRKVWTGIYAGINAGYGGNSIDSNTSNYAPSPGFNVIGSSTSSFGVGGPLAGGQIGYNYQFSNNFLLGIESDLDYADIANLNGTRRGSNSLAINGNGFNQNISGTNYDRIGLNWLGTTRLRLGYAIGNFLPYVSGGFAYGELTSTASSAGIFSYNFGAGNEIVAGNVGSGSTGVTSLGWSLGAGSEHMLADAWSIKAEYLYVSLGGIGRDDIVFSNGRVSSVSQIETGSYNIHQIRAGLNYHADWLASKPIVMSNY